MSVVASSYHTKRPCTLAMSFLSSYAKHIRHALWIGLPCSGLLCTASGRDADGADRGVSRLSMTRGTPSAGGSRRLMNTRSRLWRYAKKTCGIGLARSPCPSVRIMHGEGMEDSSMPHAKRTPKRKRRNETVPVLGAVGVSLSLAGGASAAPAVPAVDTPSQTLLPPQFTL